MKISTRGRYALRMLLDIAQQEGSGYIALKDIAARQQISKKYLEQIAMQLSQAGVLFASRGQQGGYRLQGEPGDYTVADILRITEGSLKPVACMDQNPNPCQRCEGCLTLPVWQELDRLIEEYLSSITLADVLAGRVDGRDAGQRKNQGSQMQENGEDGRI